MLTLTENLFISSFMVKPDLSTAPLISEVLEELHNLMWELEAENKDQHMKFIEEDVMFATKILMFIIGNIAIHKMIDDKVSIEDACRRMEKIGQAVREVVIEATNYDPHNFYSST